MRVAVSVLALAGVAAAGGVIAEALSSHPYFAVRRVIVRGARRLPPEQVRSAAGIEPGVSIWEVDDERAARRLRAEPWVRNARVERRMPHDVIIRVREEEPVAILAVTDVAAHEPALYWVAASGRVVAPVSPGEPRDFPYLTGLAPADVHERAAFAARAIGQALELLRVASGPHAVSEIHIDPARGLTLLPTRPAVPIDLGWEGFLDKLGRLPEVLARWAGREAEIARVSLVFDHEVIVRTRVATPGRAGRG